MTASLMAIVSFLGSITLPLEASPASSSSWLGRPFAPDDAMHLSCLAYLPHYIYRILLSFPELVVTNWEIIATDSQP
jgi:hypothetical protein